MGRTADWYSNFSREAHGQSQVYEDWAIGVAEDAAILRLLHELPLAKRQPNLIFAVSRLLGAPEGAYGPFRSWLLEHWPRVRDQALHRSTQTNEPGRCAAVLPLLARLPGPLALLEVGASAGLCLYPDRYSYRYDCGGSTEPGVGPQHGAVDLRDQPSRPHPRRLSDDRLARRHRPGTARPAQPGRPHLARDADLAGTARTSRPHPLRHRDRPRRSAADRAWRCRGCARRGGRGSATGCDAGRRDLRHPGVPEPRRSRQIRHRRPRHGRSLDLPRGARGARRGAGAVAPGHHGTGCSRWPRTRDPLPMPAPHGQSIHWFAPG